MAARKTVVELTAKTLSAHRRRLPGDCSCGWSHLATSTYELHVAQELDRLGRLSRGAVSDDWRLWQRQGLPDQLV